MRRPPIACRQAVQLLQPPAAQHVWISDELLSSTVSRFFQISCPHQKRHGSHVPGPLEARRRATKRRMTVSAGFYPQDNFASSFNLGALFGFLSKPQPAWKYEPPAAPEQLHSSNPLSVEPEVLPLSETYTRRYSFIPNLDLPSLHHVYQESSIRSEEGQAQSQSTHIAQQQNVEASFQDFKMRLTTAQPQLDREQGHIVVEAFRDCCPRHLGDAWIFNAMVMKHLAEVKLHPAPILEDPCFGNFAVPPTYSEENSLLLSSLEDLRSSFPDRVQDLLPLSLKIADSVRYAEKSVHPSQDTTLLRIFCILGHTATANGADLGKSIARLLGIVVDKLNIHATRRALSSILMDFNQAENHLVGLVSQAAGNSSLLPVAEFALSCVPKAALSQMAPSITLALAKAAAYKTRLPKEIYMQRVHVWLQLLNEEDARSGNKFVDASIASLAKFVLTEKGQDFDLLPVLLHALIFRTCRQYRTSTISATQTCDLLKQDEEHRKRRTSVYVYITFNTLIARMKEANLAYNGLIEHSLQLFVHHAQLEHVLGCLKAVKKQGVILKDPTLLSHLINKKVESARLDHTIPEEATASILNTCKTILKILSKVRVRLAPQDLRARRQFQHILDRAAADHALPLAHRVSIAEISTEERIGLIHQLAHQYSIDLTRTQSQNWRSIYYLYRYLQAHNHPIGPLFSKAIVRSSLTRPLSENTFVSSQRLKWVCDVVTKVEGENVAKQIESVFWDMRGDLIGRARHAYQAVGGSPQDKVHVNTLKQLGLI